MIVHLHQNTINSIYLYTVKSFIASLLLILFIGIQGGYVCNQLQLKLHKKAQKTSKKTNIFLRFDSAAWDKVEIMNEDEVRINGKMFDIVSIEKYNNETVLYGHYDVKEDKMLAEANDLEDEKHKLKKNISQDLLLFYQDIATSPTSIFYLQNKKKYPYLENAYLFQFKTIEIPPPQLAA